METKQHVKKLIILSNKFKRLLEKKHQKNGTYIGQARILMYLLNNKDNTTYQKDIELAFQIRSGTVSEILDNLSNQNYIVRVESVKDKRRRKIELTEKGVLIAKKSLDTIITLENDVSSILTQTEEKYLLKIFDKLNNYIDQEEENEKII